MLKDLLKAASLFLTTYDCLLPPGINSVMMEVPIILKPAHRLAEQINGLVSI